MDYKINLDYIPEEIIKFAEGEIESQNQHIESAKIFLKNTHSTIGAKTTNAIEQYIKDSQSIINMMEKHIEEAKNKINSRKPKYKIHPYTPIEFNNVKKLDGSIDHTITIKFLESHKECVPRIAVPLPEPDTTYQISWNDSEIKYFQQVMEPILKGLIHGIIKKLEEQ